MDQSIRKRPVPLKEEEQRQTLFPPLESPPLASVWRPVMTAEERAAHEKYVEENSLPF